MKRGNSDEDDELILQLLKTNDIQAHSLLYRHHFKAVLNYVRKQVRDPDQAKDIAQDLFKVIWEKRKTLVITCPIRKYLFAAAYNRLVNHLRDRDRMLKLLHHFSDELGKPKGPAEPDLELEALELSAIINKAISIMPPKAAATFSLSRSMSYKAMAAHMNISEKAVEKNMTKALRILRVYLAGYLKK